MEDLSDESTDANEWLLGYCLFSAQAKRPTIWIELHVHVDGQSIYLCHPWSLSQGARGMRIKRGDPAAFLRHEPHRVINGALAQLYTYTGFPTMQGPQKSPKWIVLQWKSQRTDDLGVPRIFWEHQNGLNIAEFFIFVLRLRMLPKPRRIMIFTLEGEHANGLPCQK